MLFSLNVCWIIDSYNISKTECTLCACFLKPTRPKWLIQCDRIVRNPNDCWTICTSIDTRNGFQLQMQFNLDLTRTHETPKIRLDVRAMFSRLFLFGRPKNISYRLTCSTSEKRTKPCWQMMNSQKWPSRARVRIFVVTSAYQWDDLSIDSVRLRLCRRRRRRFARSERARFCVRCGALALVNLTVPAQSFAPSVVDIWDDLTRSTRHEHKHQHQHGAEPRRP